MINAADVSPREPPGCNCHGRNNNRYDNRAANAAKESCASDEIVASGNPDGEAIAATRPSADVAYAESDSGTLDRSIDWSVPTASVSRSIGRSDDVARGAEGRKPKIPDGGWGWMVVLASLLISMVADGVSFSFGLLYIEFLDEFGTSKSKTAWIGSLFMAVPLLSGPIMSALVDRYGCRSMTIAGGLVSGLGFVLSSFGNTIEVMYLTFGVIAGLGLGLCYVTAVVSIAYWFDKKRNLAVGLGACGTGIGTFLYAPMTTYFIKEYGWRGTCLLLAGTFFNLIVSGTIMRDPEWWVLEQSKHQRPRSTTKSHDARSSTRLIRSGRDDCSYDEPDDLTRDHANEHLSRRSNSIGDGKFRSVINLPTFVKRSEKVPLEVLESLLRNSRLHTVVLENYPSLLLYRTLPDQRTRESKRKIHSQYGICVPTRATKRTAATKTTNERAKGSSPVHGAARLLRAKRASRRGSEETNSLLAREIACTVATTERAKPRRYVDEAEWEDATRTGSSFEIHFDSTCRNSAKCRGFLSDFQRHRLRANSCPDIYQSRTAMSKGSKAQRRHGDLVNLLKGMLDFSMFLELHFLLLSLSTVSLFVWFIVPYFYLADHLTRNGYTESDAANLLSVIGIANTVGMIALGWAGDQPWMNVSKTYTWCLIACGFTTMLMTAFTHHYALLIVISAGFGLSFASNFSFTPVILVELMPLERFTTAYGLSLLCQGIGNLIGPPLAGWLFDVTGSWELSFLVAGGCIVFSGLLMGIIPYTKNRRIIGDGPVEMERANDQCLA